MPSILSDETRRRNYTPASQGNGTLTGTKRMKDAPTLEHVTPRIDPQGRMTVPEAVDMFGAMIYSTLPVMISWGMTMSLIFGGCCSNVFALEAIINAEPKSGLLITFTQFVITALFAWPEHFSTSRPPWFLKQPAVPVLRWLPNIFLFFTVNMLNNFAFGFDISVPVHIILRSGGSVTTMLVGWIWGRRYTRMQVFSVAMLTVGVIFAAMSDAQSKGKISSTSRSAPTGSFLAGLTILFLAQILSAMMGLYTQSTYALYGPHWHENLFYSHFLSVPLFLPFFPSLRLQATRLLQSRPLEFGLPSWTSFSDHQPSSLLEKITSFTFTSKDQSKIRFPIHIVTLLINSLTQYACIRGVNLLGARTSALGVTVVLNLRKLISLFASIWLFGNALPLGVMAGAAVVFAGGGVYAWEGNRMQKRKTKSG